MPKNGVLPLGKYVKFRVKSFEPCAKFIRVFLVITKEEEDLEIKKELFKKKHVEYDTETQQLIDEEEEDEDAEYFERYIRIDSTELTLVVEHESTHDMDILAVFQAEEYDEHYFSGIDKNWLDFIKKDYYYAEPSINPQLTVATHPLSLVLKIDDRFSQFEKNYNFDKIKFGKFFISPAVLVTKACEERSKFLDQVIFIYLWISHNIRYTGEGDHFTMDIANQNPRELCKTLKGNSRSIAGLFWKCIHLMKTKSKSVEPDLDCIIVDGFVKKEDQLGYSKSNHSWNLIKFNKFWYNVDCSKACSEKKGNSDNMRIEDLLANNIANNQPFFNKEELTNLRRYFFFTKPEVLLMTHFPEEKYYSLYQDYFFTMEKFLETPIYYPKLFVSNILPTTKIVYNDYIQDFFKIEFKSDQFYHKFVLENVLGNNSILQKCHFDHQDSYIYSVFIFEFDEYGNKSFTICLEEILEKKLKRKPSHRLKSFLEGSMSIIKSKKSSKFKSESVVNRPLVNFNLQLKGDNPLRNKEDLFIPPLFLRNDVGSESNNKSFVAPTTPINDRPVLNFDFSDGSNIKEKELKKRSSLGDALQVIGSQRNPLMTPISPRGTTSSKIGMNNSYSSFNSQNFSIRPHSSFSRFLKVLSPGCYYLPEKENILFYIFWKFREGIILDGVQGEISVQKVSEDIFEFNGKFEPGIVNLKTEDGINIVEFKVLPINEFPQQLRGLIEFA